MLAKRTKRGVSIKLSNAQREFLYWALAGYLEGESRTVYGPTDPTNLNAKLYYAILHRFYLRTNFRLNLGRDEHLHLEPAEVLTVMWLLRNANSVQLLDIKATLHKLS